LYSKQSSNVSFRSSLVIPSNFPGLMYPKQMYFIVLLLCEEASSTALPAGRSSYSRRAQKKSTAEANYFYFNFLFYFNSWSRLARKRRSGSCCARASAFSYEARASPIRFTYEPGHTEFVMKLPVTAPKVQ
jgi:hypothetical protein